MPYSPLVDEVFGMSYTAMILLGALLGGVIAGCFWVVVVTAWLYHTAKNTERLVYPLEFLARKAAQIMATLQELNDTLDAVAAGVDGLEVAIADLKAQLAAQSPITQADLDALAAKAAAIGADITDTSDQG